MARVLVTRALPGSALDRLVAAGHEVDVWPDQLPPGPDELRARAAGCEALLTMLSDRIDAPLIGSLPELKVVANYAVGYDNIDLDACRERGVVVTNTPDVLTDATADLTMALLLAAARRLPEAEASVYAGDWRTWEPAGFLGVDLNGSTLVLYGGRGRIAQAVARRAEAFGMRVVTVGRGDDLTAAVADADFISLHAPLTDQTRHVIDAELLSAVKPGAILVNTARGQLVDQVALRAALIDGTLSGAALDVTDPEPLPPADPLLQAPNLIVLPHIGSAGKDTRARMAEICVDNILAALSGEPVPSNLA